MHPTYRLDDPGSLPSPSLLIFRDIVRANVRAMISLVGGDPGRLRPHVKTHKMPALIRLLEEMGIHKHKCATIAEAEMVARAGGQDVLLSYPLVGPNIARMAELVRRYPETTFRAVVDDAESARQLNEAIKAKGGRPLPVLIDLEVGMGRTGIDPERAFDLAKQVAAMHPDTRGTLGKLIEAAGGPDHGAQRLKEVEQQVHAPGLRLDGLHAYDGHIRDTDPEARLRSARPGIDAVLALRDRLWASGIQAERLIMGGTPTFPIHAAVLRPGVECSPGTCVLHDVGYASKFPDLPFTPAALILTRVVSHPRPGRITLDVGYKAVASDPQGDRVTILGVPDAKPGPQSEEHLVVDTPHADDLPPGTPLLAIPTHICPTCALYSHAEVIEGGRVVDRWEVAARDRVLGV